MHTTLENNFGMEDGDQNENDSFLNWGKKSRTVHIRGVGKLLVQISHNNRK